MRGAQAWLQVGHKKLWAGHAGFPEGCCYGDGLSPDHSVGSGLLSSLQGYDIDQKVTFDGVFKLDCIYNVDGMLI